MRDVAGRRRTALLIALAIALGVAFPVATTVMATHIASPKIGLDNAPVAREPAPAAANNTAHTGPSTARTESVPHGPAGTSDDDGDNRGGRDDHDDD